MTSTDWKQKYLDSLEHTEIREKQFQHLSALFRQGMSRVALAAQGQDPQLDKELNTLRKLITSNNTEPQQLEAIIEALSLSVSRLDETRSKDAQHIRPQDLLAQWLDRLILPQDLHKTSRNFARASCAVRARIPSQRRLPNWPN
jgi:diguanylate cyclase